MDVSLGDPAVLAALRSDDEFRLAGRSLTGILRLARGTEEFDLGFVNGTPVSLQPARGGITTARLSGTERQWDSLLNGEYPLSSFGQSPVADEGDHVRLEADFLEFAAPYGAAVRRLIRILKMVNGRQEPIEHVNRDPFESTDVAVGRYIYIDVNGTRFRVYYEEAGQGTPLLLQHTAGADGRQWRHLLADPEMQKRYRMIAYDLPYHGKSLPPLNGSRWWEKEYVATQADLVAQIVAIKRALELDRPLFMGVSIGGHLAADVLAESPEDFRAAVGINGWYQVDLLESFDNTPFHHPQVSSDFWGNMMYEASSPVAPEEFRREVAWIYASSGPSVYKGDNEYFLHDHDLRINGNRINTTRTPLFVLAGEYDIAATAPGGGPDIAKNIPGAEYRQLPALSHFAMADDPVRFNAAIRPILREAVELSDRFSNVSETPRMLAKTEKR